MFLLRSCIHGILLCFHGVQQLGFGAPESALWFHLSEAWLLDGCKVSTLSSRAYPVGGGKITLFKKNVLTVNKASKTKDALLFSTGEGERHS